MDIVKIFIEGILYPAMERKKGNKTREYISELKATQDLSESQLYEMQKDKLEKLLLECVRKVPAYKSYSYLEDQIKEDPFEALKTIPILRKNDFRNDSESYINESVDKSALIPNISGGSTGQPVRFYMDRKTVEYYEAARWRGLSWSGITPGSRSVMIWGNPIELDSMKQKKYAFRERWLKNRIIIPAYSLESESILDYIKKIESFKPEYFYGYASALDAFATLMLKNNLKLSFTPKAVVSTAETLHSFQRKNIEKAFACNVINEYGARDAGILAFQCKSGSMHISAENAILEVVDPLTFKPLAKGRSGVVLVTDMNNLSMPRLRYELGDRVTLSDKKCTCGINLPILENIDGREDDMFITPDGKFVHGHLFSHAARPISSIKNFQIVQKSPDSAELKILLEDNNDKEGIDIFIEELKGFLPKVNIEVKIVDDIPVTKSGKFRYAIRQFKLDDTFKNNDSK